MTDNLTPHLAGDYDSEVQKTIPYYTNFHDETIDLIHSVCPNVQYWLDTGCGTGTLIKKALPQFPDCKFYVSDPSQNMVQICKDTFREKRIEILEKATTLEIKMELLPDVITAIQCHHYLDKKSRIKTTKFCYDLLNPEGVYITFENIKPETEEGIKVGLNRWAGFQKKQGKAESEVKNHVGRFGENYFPITIGEHINLMKKAGFRTVEMFWMSYMQAGFYGIK